MRRTGMLYLCMAANDDTSWRSALPEDMREDPSIKDVKDIPTLAKNLIETKRKVGSMLSLPGKDATEEERREFSEKVRRHNPNLVELPPEAEKRQQIEEQIMESLGRKKEPKDYVAEGEIPEGLDMEAIRARAAKMGLTKKQFRALVDEAKDVYFSTRKAREDEAKALQKEWGVALDERVSAARSAAVKLGKTTEEAQALTPSELKIYFNAAKALGDEAPGATGGEPSTGKHKLSPSEAKAEQTRIRKKLLTERILGPERDDLLRQMAELAESAFAGED
jgi:hypothetical protein